MNTKNGLKERLLKRLGYKNDSKTQENILIIKREYTKMAIAKESINIKRPVDKVFAYTTDANNLPKWVSGITESEQMSKGPWYVGTTTKGISHVAGASIKWTGKVTEYETNRKWTMKTTTVGVIFEEYWSYDPIEGGTKFTKVYDMKIVWFLKLFTPMLVNWAQKSLKVSLINLKSILEAEV
jgi:uncharacterized protein YndB with AHSA1/START domain